MIKDFKVASFFSHNFVTTFNFFSITYILLILSFSGQVSLAGEAFVTLSIIQLFTHGFSSNLRNIYIANKKIIPFEKIISLRLFIGIMSFMISNILILYFISSINIGFHITLVLLAVLGWIFEIILAKNQLEKKINNLFLYNSFCFIVTIPIVIIVTSIDILIILILFYSFFNIFLFRKYLFQTPVLITNSVQLHFKKFKLGFSSTLLKYISNFIYRYLVFFLIGSYKAGLLFVAFSIGSFLGTVFDVSYGAFFVKSLNKIRNYFLYFLMFGYLLLVILLLYIASLYSVVSANDLYFLNNAVIPSIIGGIIMVHALIIRQKLFKKASFQKICFKVDIMGYFMVILSVPILFYINETYVIYAYLLNSIFLYLIYILVANVDFEINK